VGTLLGRLAAFIVSARVVLAMRGIFIGRFQPYHGGHANVVADIATQVDELVVGVGSADDSHTGRDPFTAGERVTMVTQALEAADHDLTTYVVPIEDIERNAIWISHIESMCPAFDVAYANNPLVVRLFEEAGVEVRSTELYDRGAYEGTEIRRRMRDGEDWRALVPDAVAAVIDEIDGVERIQQVTATDANGDR
jgi:nicotinamide-nucleotide adenylyltransferase